MIKNNLLINNEQELKNFLVWKSNILIEIIKWKLNSILEFNSNIPWKTTTIMVWVHWNELSWINALNDILKEINIISWKVYFILANLKAIEIWKRFFEKNLNRCFVEDNNWNTYEDKRAKEIIKYLNESDCLLDVHNTLNKENSIPFLITENPELWKFFDVKLVINWFKNIQLWWSDWYMSTIWKIWLCLESWSIYDVNWINVAKKWILNFLKFTWNIDWKPEEYKNQKYMNFDFLYKNTSLDFQFTKNYKDFEKVKKWEIIAYDWWKELVSDRNWYIVFNYIPEKIWDECFCLWKDI